MKIQIEPIHVGRYKISVFREGADVQVFDGGSALIMVMLTRMIFAPEHTQYELDQRANSDQLAKEALCKMQADPTLNPHNLPRLLKP